MYICSSLGQSVTRRYYRIESIPSHNDFLLAYLLNFVRPRRQLLGINGFTYLLGGLIVFFLSMNAVLGPGWLGNSIGIQGTGSFVERSDTLPNVVDLGEDRFSL